MISWRRLIEWFRREWHAEETRRMRRLADRYQLRAHMDGEVIRKTGEVVRKESV